ncbi:hypothetical protein QBC38DRAFT_461043 [Podospora fimiseda]|uniref:Uncharacterized protein n=1 Tax=Podospora fimiseda TaxID=252190 RepID=A0AAN6YM74_9PEZI|nr:hypothetical protein QBC38DRAFT_461043 [Podospora fimiseda]
MSRGGKAITIGLVVALGIANGFYSFAPALKDERDKREGTYLRYKRNPIAFHSLGNKKAHE